jgi:ankyrin repeat protein
VCALTAIARFENKLALFLIHAHGSSMARKKAHKQPLMRPPTSMSLDELLARARTGVTQRIKEYLDAGGSPTRQVEVKALTGESTTVPLLHSLCLSCHEVHEHLTDSIGLLTKAGAQIDSTCIDTEGNSCTALMWACEVATNAGCTHPVEALLAAGADVNSVSVTDGATAVNIAAARGNVRAVRMLLQHGADPFVLEHRKVDAVGWAAGAGFTQVLELLKNHNPTMFNSSVPLATAAASGQLQCAKWLLSKGAQLAYIDAIDTDDRTALQYAAENNNERMLQLLLTNGANVRVCNEGGWDALSMLACNSGNVHRAELLLAAGADVAHTDHQGVGAVHLAVEHGKAELVQLLLQHGAAVLLNSLYPKGCDCCSDVTAVMDSKHAAIAKMLLAAGADVQIRSTTGNTCLHVAAQHSYSVPVVCLLIRAGTDIAAVNDDGKTAAQIARDNGNELLAALLDRAAVQQA